MSASKNLFWGLVTSVALFPACGISKPTANNNRTATDQDDGVPTRFNSISAHEKIVPKSFTAHSQEFAESKMRFTQGRTISTIGINIKDSTYFLKTFDLDKNLAVTTYMGEYARQDQNAKDLFPKAQQAIQSSKTKLPKILINFPAVSASGSNTVTIFSNQGGNFEHKTIVNLKDKTMFECACDTNTQSAQRKYQRNAELVKIAESYHRRSKKFKI